jgi:tetratricopeptide (TPR) repeat protein
MKKTGKVSTVLLTALLATLMLVSTFKPAKASIQSFIWEPGSYVYKGYDNYYGTYIVAYLDGSTVRVTIPIYDDLYPGYGYSDNINVTDVYMVFDWGLNQTCDTDLPAKIDYGETGYFEVSFEADEGDASNAWAHTYTAYATFNYTYYGTNYTNIWTQSYDYRFVVWSEDQKDALDLSRTIDTYADYYPPGYFSTIEGSLNAIDAIVEASLGDTYWAVGNFTEAKTHYQNAVDLYDDAFAAEGDKGVAMEDAQLNATKVGTEAGKKTADAAMLQAQAAMSQAYGYILLGLGFLLIGVGAILFGLKKPKPP